MKKTDRPKKLTFTTEKIRTLTPDQLTQVPGGYPTGTDSNNLKTCSCHNCPP